ASLPSPALPSFPTRRSSDLYGRRPVLIVSVALFGLMALGCAWAQAPWQLGALRFVSGLGLGAAVVTALTVTGETAPPAIRSTVIDRKSTRLNSSHGSISYAV